MKARATGPLTDVLIDFQALTHQLNFSVGVFDKIGKTLLDSLYLLRDGTQNAFLQTIELVEAPPSSDLAKTNKDTTHSLEVECLITTKNKDEATKLDTESLDGFGFAFNKSASCRLGLRKTDLFQQGRKGLLLADCPRLV